MTNAQVVVHSAIRASTQLSFSVPYDDWRPQWYRLWWANMVVKRVHRFLLCFIQSLRPSPPEIRVHVDSLLERVHSLLRDHEDAEHLLRRYERYWPAALA